jgi:hypothetical protein
VALAFGQSYYVEDKLVGLKGNLQSPGWGHLSPGFNLLWLQAA